ncbi:MAG: sulfur carrier protein ThiS adenylyltransferase ThiF [Bacteroidales bacterium]|nr:sulfur carrier protein ThiS adenylyltransferase ThiF [Bacteroidales bacterium]
MRIIDIKRHLGHFRAGIAGAGGLGSNCAVALARSGIGTLVIADYDQVEESNLSRQYYFKYQTGKYKTDALREIISLTGSETKVITFNTELNRQNIVSIFKGCHVVVEAFDRAEMKEMFVETLQKELPGVPLVIASGVAGYGMNDTLRSRKIDDTLFVCGDESSETSSDLPPMAPRVGIVANMQANIVIELLMKMKPDKSTDK